jgi:hypothetical protein
MALSGAERQQKLRDERKLKKEIDECYLKYLKDTFGKKTAKDILPIYLNQLEIILAGGKLSYGSDRAAIEKMDYLRLVIFKDVSMAQRKKNIFETENRFNYNLATKGKTLAPF